MNNRNKIKNVDRFPHTGYFAVQAVFWMTYCATVSFAIVFLQSRGYTNAVAGIILAAGNILGFFISSYMSALIDRIERCTVFLMISITLCIQAAAIVAVLLIPGQNLAVALLFVINLSMVLARNPLVVELCVDMQYAGKDINFSVARAIGSLAFVLISFALGPISKLSVNSLLYIGLGFMALNYILVKKLEAAVPLNSAAEHERAANASSSLVFIKKHPKYILMVFGITIIFFGHNTINNYLINVMRYLGGDEGTMGLASGLTAAYEIPIILFYRPLTRKMRTSTAMAICFCAFALKNLCMALSTTVPMYLAAATLQSLSYAVFVNASMNYAKEIIPREDSAKGQAFIANVSMTGAILSGICGGIFYDRLGVKTTMMISAATVFIGAVISLSGLQKTSRDKALASN